jgi:hypothetical protein
MKKNTSHRMFIFVMIMTVIVVLATTRRESYNPWLPWNWFRKPERPRPYPMPERPYPMPERPYPMPERPYPMPKRPYPMPERPYPMPERPRPMPEPPRPRCHPLSLDPRCRAIDPSELIFSNRPAQPISPGVRARMQSR